MPAESFGRCTVARAWELDEAQDALQSVRLLMPAGASRNPVFV
jgi:hypothetical protein